MILLIYTKSLLLYSSITKALGKKGYYLPNAVANRPCPVANLCLPKASHMHAVALGRGQKVSGDYFFKKN